MFYSKYTVYIKYIIGEVVMENKQELKDKWCCGAMFL